MRENCRHGERGVMPWDNVPPIQGSAGNRTWVLSAHHVSPLPPEPQRTPRDNAFKHTRKKLAEARPLNGLFEADLEEPLEQPPADHTFGRCHGKAAVNVQQVSVQVPFNPHT